MPSKKRTTFSNYAPMAQPSYAVCPSLNLRKFFDGKRGIPSALTEPGTGPDRSARYDSFITSASKNAGALMSFQLPNPGPLCEKTSSHFIAGRVVQLNIDGPRDGPQRMMCEAVGDKDRQQHQDRRQKEIEKARRAPR